MPLFNDYQQGCSYLHEMPSFYQENSDKVNPRVRQHIFNGVPCEYDDNIRNALKRHTGGSSIRNYVLAALFINTALAVGKGIIELKKPSIGLAALAVFACVLIFAALIFLFRGKANNAAVSAADSGNVQCFIYRSNGVCRFEIDHIDKDCFYFADLGDFMVKLPVNRTIPPTVYGAVIVINGEEYFYLLV